MTAEWRVRGIVRRTLPVLVALTTLELVGGLALDGFEATLLRYPTLLVLVPVTIGTAGNLAAITCSRLTTQLYLGTYELSPSNPALRANAGAVFGLAATVFGAVGIAAWGIGLALGGSLALGRVLLISLVSGLCLAVLVVVLPLQRRVRPRGERRLERRHVEGGVVDVAEEGDTAEAVGVAVGHDDGLGTLDGLAGAAVGVLLVERVGVEETGAGEP